MEGGWICGCDEEGYLRGVVKEFWEVGSAVPSVTCAEFLDLLVELIDRGNARLGDGLGNGGEEDMLCGLGSLERNSLRDIDYILFDIQIHWFGKWRKIKQWEDPIVAKQIVLVVLLDKGSWLVLVVFITIGEGGSYKAW